MSSSRKNGIFVAAFVIFIFTITAFCLWLQQGCQSHERMTLRKFPSSQNREIVEYYMGELRGIGRAVPRVPDAGSCIVTSTSVTDIPEPSELVTRDYVRPLQRALSHLEEGNQIHQLRILLKHAIKLEAHSSATIRAVSFQKLRLPQDLSAIIFPFETGRQFAMPQLKEASEASEKVPFSSRKPRAVWRGKLSGNAHGRRYLLLNNASDKGDIGHVEINEGSPSIDFSTKGRYTVAEMCQFKYIISVEGEGKDAGLAWKMLSGSVILMAEPHLESWLQEFSLLPYVHFVPLERSMRDITEKVEWCENNQGKCKEIIEDAQKHIKGILDLNHFEVGCEILKRYSELYTFTKADRLVRPRDHKKDRITDLLYWPSPDPKRFIHTETRRACQDVYLGFLGSIRLRIFSILEITSLKNVAHILSWKHYFTNVGKVVGVRVTAEAGFEKEEINSDPVTVRYNCHLSDENLNEISKEGPFDLIIYAGNRSRISPALSILWKRLEPFGTYIVEDLDIDINDSSLKLIRGQKLANLQSVTLATNLVVLKKKA